MQDSAHDAAEVIFGRTDGEGKSNPVIAPGLSEVIFVVLNKNYKDFLEVNKVPNDDVYVVKKSDTLANIAKRSGTTVDALQKINNITNPDKIKVGQKIQLHDGDYLWRRPPMDLITRYLKKSFNIHQVAGNAIVEHKRSHIVLPAGNASQRHGADAEVVAIRGGKSSLEVSERKKTEEVPHTTVEKEIKKTIIVVPQTAGTTLEDNLLFPLRFRPQQSYHHGARKFNSSRGVRRHAGCDLYASVGTEVRAMADGVVVNYALFYWDTYVIEIDHGGFIVRYGEVRQPTTDERRSMVGTTVKRGQVIGHVGQLVRPNGVNYPDSMLHLEIYNTGESPASTKLTDKSRAPFQRRADLVNPTAILDNCLME